MSYFYDDNYRSRDENHPKGEFSSSPMPWVGIYIAAASTICSLAMAADAIRSFRKRNLWFPCKFFTLNATSLTLLAIVIKLPMDLNESMPGAFDHLSKLSSVAFMATSMANFLPSLGGMDSKDVLLNMVALFILVITLVVNVSIQLGTNLIIKLRCEVIFVVCFTFVLLLMMSCSAFVVPTTKRILERKYQEMSKTISGGGGFGVEKLRDDVSKYWLMAESSNPQFVIVRSPTCFASSVISWLSGVVLLEAFCRLFLFSSHSENELWYDGCCISDYGETTKAIFIIQSVGVIVGTLVSMFRCFITAKLRYSSGDGARGSSGANFSVEAYWTERLMEWKERPLPLHKGGRCLRKQIKNLKDMVLCLLIKVQISIVFICKYLQRYGTKSLLSCCLKVNSVQESDVSRYILHLEGEEYLPHTVMAENKNTLSKFLERGVNQQPRDLAKLLGKISADFHGLARFDSKRVHSLCPEEPPNCWKSSIITLASIAIAVPHTDAKEIKHLLCGVKEGLKYVNIVDEILSKGGRFKKVRDAADTIWSEVDLSGRFLNNDLRQMGSERNEPKETLGKLCDFASDYVKKSESLANDCSHWPIKVIAANTMYRISKSLLLQLESEKMEVSSKEMLERISVMIADILGACLMNLPRAIMMKCSSVSIEKSEDTVQDMARIVGETEEIMKMLQPHHHRQLQKLGDEQMIDIEEWRRVLVDIDISPLVSNRLSSSDIASTSSVEAEIIIDS